VKLPRRTQVAARQQINRHEQQIEATQGRVADSDTTTINDFHYNSELY
jgi:hypothetical protein